MCNVLHIISSLVPPFYLCPLHVPILFCHFCLLLVMFLSHLITPNFQQNTNWFGTRHGQHLRIRTETVRGRRGNQSPPHPPIPPPSPSVSSSTSVHGGGAAGDAGVSFSLSSGLSSPLLDTLLPHCQRTHEDEQEEETTTSRCVSPLWSFTITNRRDLTEQT